MRYHKEEGMSSMKIITFVVPSYNSAEYMHRCLDSLVLAGEAAQIIIVNDGSVDNTGTVADSYQAKYPTMVEVVHKANGGHGSGVNAGLERAKGIYFKVVDSDDWLEEKALEKMMNQLKYWVENKQEIDLLVCNYVYNHLYENRTKSMGYQGTLPVDEVFTWKDVKRFKTSQYLVMHSLIYRTEVLRTSGVKLPEHTFYVDNLFSNQPLRFVDTMYYMDMDLYQYFLGRDDQSVNEQVMMRRIDQQILVTKLVLEKSEIAKARGKNKKLAVYLTINVSIMLSICGIHLLLIGDQEALQKRKDLWKAVKGYDKKIYLRLRFMSLSGATYLPTKLGTIMTMFGYQKAKKKYEFN